jgi:hypothetical protein
MSPDMPQAWTLAFNTTKAGAFAERGPVRIFTSYTPIVERIAENQVNA